MLEILPKAAAFSLAVTAGAASADDIQPHQYKMLGTWSSLGQFKNYEAPFWAETPSANADGQMSGEVVSISVMGLKGYETLNLPQNGVFDIVLNLYVVQSIRQGGPIKDVIKGAIPLCLCHVRHDRPCDCVSLDGAMAAISSPKFATGKSHGS